MVVVGERHPVRRHVYNLCLRCDGACIESARWRARRCCCCCCCTSGGPLSCVCVRVRACGCEHSRPVVWTPSDPRRTGSSSEELDRRKTQIHSGKKRQRDFHFLLLKINFFVTKLRLLSKNHKSSLSKSHFSKKKKIYFLFCAIETFCPKNETFDVQSWFFVVKSHVSQNWLFNLTFLSQN